MMWFPTSHSRTRPSARHRAAARLIVPDMAQLMQWGSGGGEAAPGHSVLAAVRHIRAGQQPKDMILEIFALQAFRRAGNRVSAVKKRPKAKLFVLGLFALRPNARRTPSG